MDDHGMIEFEDRAGRLIKIEVDDDWPFTVTASHDGREIGKFEFTEYEGEALLEHANVHADYQKAGIGTRMMKELIELDEGILVPNPRWSASTGHPYYLSVEGSNLVNACIRAGILDKQNVAPFGRRDLVEG